MLPTGVSLTIYLQLVPKLAATTHIRCVSLFSSLRPRKRGSSTFRAKTDDSFFFSYLLRENHFSEILVWTERWVFLRTGSSKWQLWGGIASRRVERLFLPFFSLLFFFSSFFFRLRSSVLDFVSRNTVSASSTGKFLQRRSAFSTFPSEFRNTYKKKCIDQIALSSKTLSNRSRWVRETAEFYTRHRSSSFITFFLNRFALRLFRKFADGTSLITASRSPPASTCSLSRY